MPRDVVVFVAFDLVLFCTLKYGASIEIANGDGPLEPRNLRMSELGPANTYWSSLGFAHSFAMSDASLRHCVVGQGWLHRHRTMYICTGPSRRSY